MRRVMLCAVVLATLTVALVVAQQAPSPTFEVASIPALGRFPASSRARDRQRRAASRSSAQSFRLPARDLLFGA